MNELEFDVTANAKLKRMGREGGLAVNMDARSQGALQARWEGVQWWRTQTMRRKTIGSYNPRSA